MFIDKMAPISYKKPFHALCAKLWMYTEKIIHIRKLPQGMNPHDQYDLTVITTKEGDLPTSPDALRHIPGSETVEIVGTEPASTIGITGREHLASLRDGFAHICQELNIP